MGRPTPRRRGLSASRADSQARHLAGGQAWTGYPQLIDQSYTGLHPAEMASLRSRAAELAMDIEAFFHGYEHSRQIFDALAQAIQGLQPTTITVSKSQVAFRRRRLYAWAWIPGKYLRGGHAPLVLTLALRRRDPSPRWKEVVEPRPGRFTHHLELHSPGDLDGEALDWMHEAWSEAG